MRSPEQVGGPMAAASGSQGATPGAGRVVLVSLWRLLIAGAAWTGVALSVVREAGLVWINLAFFTQVSGLLVALTATGSLLYPLWHRGTLEGGRGYLRGVTAGCSMVTLIIFATLLGGDYSALSSLLLHLVVPLLALADWLLVGRNQTALPAWVPFAWLTVPYAYLPLYLWASGRIGPLYGFLVPGTPSFLPVVGILTVAFLVIFGLYWGLGRLRGRMLAPTSAGPRA